MADRAQFIPVRDGERRRIGPCDVEFIPVTHSVPHAFATAFHTPQGIILHSGDFKIYLHPVDGRRTDLARMGALASEPGIRLFLADSTNAEEPGFTPSESTVGATLEKVFLARPDRRFIVTCFASHIHRVQQVADAAIAGGRSVATLGLSMKKNVVRTARDPRRVAGRHRGHRRPRSRKRLRHLHRIPGGAHVGTVPLGLRRESFLPPPGE
jgi:ribonuclease J